MTEPVWGQPAGRGSILRGVIWLGGAASPALLALAALAPWPWLAPFIGRFHPVVLHFPIVLLLLAGVCESIDAANPSAGRLPMRLLLFFAAFSAVGAATLGWLLMRADAVSGPLADRHLQGGVALALLAWITLGFYLQLAPPGPGWRRTSYRCALALTCLVLLRTAHDGASLTHGEDYLKQYAPWNKRPKRAEIGFPTTQPVAQWDVYAHVVAPILQTRCEECHGTSQVKGGLNLETWAAIQKGGKSGAAVVAGQPDQSLLLQRMNLPVDDQNHMPPKRKAQPSPEEVVLVQKWIALGAPPAATLGSLHFDNRLLSVVGKLPDLLHPGAVAAANPPEEIDPREVARLRAPLAPAVERLQRRYPFALHYISRASAELELNAKLLGRAFGDNDLASFAPIGAKLVWVDLSNTAITNRSGAALRAMKNLASLRLAYTGVTDGILREFLPLEHLEVLSVYGTALTRASAADLAKLTKLKKIYIGQTGLSAEDPALGPLHERIVARR